MPTRYLTFQTVLPGCENGDADCWRFFLTTYTPIASRLLAAYVPELSEEARTALWRDALQALAADDFKRLREFDHQAEREFLVDLKSFVLELAAIRLGEPGGESRLSSESVRGRLDGRPIAHQEILLLKLGGYSESDIEKVLVIPATLVASALAPAAGAAPLGGSAVPAAGARAWLGFLHEIHAARTPDCPDRRIFVRILDGQISWYDKTPAETHMAKCLHCLDFWASLREADSFRRQTAPIPESQVAGFLPALALAAAPEGRNSWFGKLLRR